MRALVVAHDHVSPIGAIGERLEDHGFDLTIHQVVDADRHWEPDVRTEFPSFADFDVVVPMGAPWSVYDAAAIGSWVVPELEQVRSADAAGVPVLGICFGGQLLAAALGGRVLPSERPELGWYDVQSDEPDVVPDGPWFEWHYDRWDLPPGAVEIARNESASQAFVLRRNLAVQFHPELDSVMLKGWLANGGESKAVEFGHDVTRLVEQTADVDDRSRRRAHQLVDGFLRLSTAEVR